MSEKPADIVARAELCLGKRQFSDAAKCFEEAAAAEADRTRRAALLKRAGGAYLEERSLKDAGRCYWQLGALLEKKNKAETLMVYWRGLIMAIAGSRTTAALSGKANLTTMRTTCPTSGMSRSTKRKPSACWLRCCASKGLTGALSSKTRQRMPAAPEGRRLGSIRVSGNHRARDSGLTCLPLASQPASQ